MVFNNNIKSLLLFFVVISLSCKNISEKENGKLHQKQYEFDKEKVTQEQKDTLVTSIEESEDYSVAKILIRKEGKEIIKLDTLYGPYPSINSRIIDKNTGIVNYKYGQGNSIESHSYTIDLNKLTFINTLQYSAGSDVLWVSRANVSVKFVDFSEESTSDLSIIKEEDKVIFKIPLNSNIENGKVDLTQFEKYVKDLYTNKDVSKLRICCDQEVFSIINSYISFSDKTTINALNNIAYYLEQSKAYKEAIFLLEKIVKEFPDRTVAYINLGDAYWGLGEKEKAKKVYTIYIDQMKASGKESKIPKTVLERV